MSPSKQEQPSTRLAGLCKQSAVKRHHQFVSLSMVLLVALLSAASGTCHAWRQHQNQEPAAPTTAGHHQYRAPRSPFAARRAADDSRPLVRVASQQQEQVVMGKFKAPAPNQMHRQRVPKSSDFAAQTVGSSYRILDTDADPSQPEKIVHGTFGASLMNSSGQQRPTSVQRTVGAKIQVSDEGLNYPPSKLSADIYGNVAEIVTAPPDLVDNDFLLPHSNRWNSARRP